MKEICNLEVRKFNFTELPTSVRNLTSFAWKVYMIAVSKAGGILLV